MIPALPPTKTILRTELAADAAGYEFTAAAIAERLAALPFPARHFVLTTNARSSIAAVRDDAYYRLNGDAGNNYNLEFLVGVGAGPPVCGRLDNQNIGYIGAVTGNTAPANVYSGGQTVIVDAFGGRSHNSYLVLAGAHESNVVVDAGRRASLAAVASILVACVGGDLMAGTVLELAVVDERYLVAGGEQILLAAAASISVGNLPQVPGDLSIIGNLRSTRAAANDPVYIALNGDAAAGNYARQLLAGLNAGPPVAGAAADRWMAHATGATASVGAFAPITISISQSALGDNDPHVLSIGGFHESNGPSARVQCFSLRRNNTEPVHTVAFTPSVGPNFLAGSGMWVYKTPKRLLERVVLDAPAASTVFDNDGAGLSQNYRDLGASAYARTGRADTNDQLIFWHNGDAVPGNYVHQRLLGTGAAVAASQVSPWSMLVVGDTAGAGIYGGGTVLFPEYSKADRHKHRLVQSGVGFGDGVDLYSGRWTSPDPIESITIVSQSGADFLAGCVFELWGIGRVDDDIYIEVGGTEITNRQDGSLNIRNAIEERSTCSFTIVDSTGTATYSKGQPVEVLQHTHPLFGGIIDRVKHTKLRKSTTVNHTITAVGYEALADKRLIAATYAAQTAEFIVRDIGANYLNAEGIWLGNIETGPTITEALFNYGPGGTVLSRLAERSGKVWGVDPIKRLYFQDPASTPAPWAVDTDMITKLSPVTTQQAPKYRNRQFVRAGRDITAPQTENFVGDATVVAFTVGYPINSVPAVTVAGAPQTIGIKGLDPAGAFQCYWSKSDPVIVFTAAPGAAVAVQVVYIGQFPILVQAEDVAAIAARKAVEGGTGIWETLDDEPAIQDSVEALDDAEAKLDKYSVIGELMRFGTNTQDFAPGQLASVTWLGAAQDMLIESVVITEIKPNLPHYAITAVIGPALGDWTNLFGGMAKKTTKILDRLTIGTDEILLILAKQSGNWEWDELVTEAVYACTTPGAGPPFVGTGLLVC